MLMHPKEVAQIDQMEPEGISLESKEKRKTK